MAYGYGIRRTKVMLSLHVAPIIVTYKTVTDYSATSTKHQQAGELQTKHLFSTSYV